MDRPADPGPTSDPRVVPLAIPLAVLQAESHDPGVTDRALLVDGVRWALVDYGPGCARADWCDTPHCGYVVSGAIRYDFEDGRPPLAAERGSAFVLTAFPRHRGSNPGAQPASLFLIDALPSQPQ